MSNGTCPFCGDDTSIRTKRTHICKPTIVVRGWYDQLQAELNAANRENRTLKQATEQWRQDLDEANERACEAVRGVFSAEDLCGKHLIDRDEAIAAIRELGEKGDA